MQARSTISVGALRGMVAELPTLSVGRASVSELALGSPSESPQAGVAFGALEDEARMHWVAALLPGALVMHVVAAPSEGVRALFARFTKRALDVMPIDEACTGLFAAGVRELCIYEVEGRRDLRVILGRRSVESTRHA